MDGHISSVKCGEKEVRPELTLTQNGDSSTFDIKGPFSAGFSDTIWYGEDHFSLCHHIVGIRTVIRYKASKDNGLVGSAEDIEFRDEFPAPPTKASSDSAK